MPVPRLGARPSQLARLSSLMLSAALALAVLLPARPATAANTAVVTDTTITITVPIDIVAETVQGDPGYFDRLWTASINIWWNREGNHFSYTCPDSSRPRRVIFVPDIQVRSGANVRDDAHTVEAMPGESSVPGAPRADVHWPEFYDPSEDVTLGHWPEEKRPPSIAHEFGHILGLGDEYETRVDEDGETFSQPRPEYDDGSLMASLDGEVLQRHINAAVENHLSPDQLGCSPTLTEPPGGPTPDSGCPLSDTTLYYGALPRDVSGEQLNCSLTIVGCGQLAELKATVNYKAGERCPWIEHDRITVASSEPGPRVCCEALRRCPDDLDCDGVLDQEDGSPLDPGSRSRPRAFAPALDRLLLSVADLPTRSVALSPCDLQ